jgi:hypothetical protein
MPAIEPPGRFFIRMAEDHVGVVALRSPAEMVRDVILAAVFHRFLPVSVVSDASASMTLYGVKFFPDAADGLAMDANGLPISVSLPARTRRTTLAGFITVHVAYPTTYANSAAVSAARRPAAGRFERWSKG